MNSSQKSKVYRVLLALVVIIAGLLPIVATAQTSSSSAPRPEYPPLSTVTKDYELVQSTPLGSGAITLSGDATRTVRCWRLCRAATMGESSS
jgi:hypothetical protein